MESTTPARLQLQLWSGSLGYHPSVKTISLGALQCSFLDPVAFNAVTEETIS